MVVGVWRHFAISDLHLNQWSPWANLIVGFELHGANAAFAVTDHTVFVDDAANFAVIGEVVGIVGLRLGLNA